MHSYWTKIADRAGSLSQRGLIRRNKSILSTVIVAVPAFLMNFGKHMDSKQLSRCLAEYIRRYRIVSLRVLLADLANVKHDSIISVLRSMPHLHVFFDNFGEEVVCRRRRKQPSSFAITKCLVTQSFCNANNRILLTKQELRKHFPTLFRFGLPAGYYVDNSNENPVLGLLRVDSHLADVRRIRQKSFGLFEKHRGKRDFYKLIMNSQFEITWAVPTTPKAEAIRIQFHNQQKLIPVYAEPVDLLLDRSIAKTMN